MTPEQLKSNLLELSEHEIRYQQGWENPNLYKDMKEIKFRNESVWVCLPSSENWELSGSKHSRFIKYPIHIHPWVEINYMYSGSCIQKINGLEVPLKKGQTLILNQNTLHDIPVLGKNDILLNIVLPLNYLTISFFNKISTKNIISEFLFDSITKDLEHSKYILFSTQDSRRLPIYIDEFFCEYIEPSTCSKDILNSLVSLIITELINHAPINDTHKNQQYVLPILKYIEENYNSISLKQTAHNFGLNPDYLSKILKKKTGSSFQEILIQQRIIVAKNLLSQSSLSISEVSQEVGYENITFFYKKFKEHTGQSPLSYRNTFN